MGFQRFEQKILHTDGDGLPCILETVIPGENVEGSVAGQGDALADRLKAGHFRHADVHESQVNPVFAQHGQHLLAGARLVNVLVLDSIIVQYGPDGQPDQLFVVSNQKFHGAPLSVSQV